MYIACRHIQPSGLRCKARALKGRDFCYHHARLHTRSDDPAARYANLQLPVVEDAAAVRLSSHLISQAIINQTIDIKRARLLLYSLQISAHTLDRKAPFHVEETVSSTEPSGDGEELAPVLRVCGKDELCEKCPHAEDCPDYHQHAEDPNDPNVLLRTLVSLGKHLDEPCPPGFFPQEENSEETEHDRKIIEAWRKRWGQLPASKQGSPPTDQSSPISDH